MQRSRCSAHCILTGAPLLSCIGLCNKEIHPICGGISTNRMRLQAPDEYMVFYCQDCRARDHHRFADAFQQLATQQEEVLETLKNFACKIDRMEKQLKTFVEHVDELTVAVGESGNKASARVPELKEQLHGIKSAIEYLQQRGSDSCISESQMNTLLNEKLTNYQRKLATTIGNCSNRPENPSFSSISTSTQTVPAICNSRPICIVESLNHTPSATDLSTIVTFNSCPHRPNDFNSNKSGWTWIYVSNLAACTTASELKDHVGKMLNTKNIICNPLVKKSKRHINLEFICFKVGIKDYHHKDLLHPDLWPFGAFIRRFYVGQNR